MNPKNFAFAGGFLMLAMGVLSLIPAFSSAAVLPDLRIETSYGLFLGLFPMNIFNKLALILFGVVGMTIANSKKTSYLASRNFSRIVFFVMGTLAILGLFPQTNTLFGYIPLFGGEVWAHALFATAGAIFGFAPPERRTSYRYPRGEMPRF